MVRRTIIAAVLALLMVSGVVSATPTATAGIKIDNSIGFVSAPNQVWKPKCARYLVRWNLHPPTRDWSAKAQVFGPPARRRRVHHILLDAGSDPRRGSQRITLCGATARPGRYAIQVTMLIDDGPRRSYYRRSEPTFFRLIRR